MSKRSAVRTQWAGAGCGVGAAFTAAQYLWGLPLAVASGLAVLALSLLLFGWAGEVDAVTPERDGQG